MSRSVSTHPHAVATVFLRPEGDEHPAFDEQLGEDLLESIRNVLTGDAGVDSGVLLNDQPFTGFQGYEHADRWVGRENLVILEGELSVITVSEYAGIVSVCLAPLDPEEETHVTACLNAAPYFLAILQQTFSDICFSKLGTFSNGESVYKKFDA